jgi:hypothetical protein
LARLLKQESFALKDPVVNGLADQIMDAANELAALEDNLLRFGDALQTSAPQDQQRRLQLLSTIQGYMAQVQERLAEKSK